MTDWSDQLLTVFHREIQAIWRTQLIWLLASGFFVVVLGIGFVGGAGGYVPLSLSLLTPLELLVPVLAAGLGSRAILAPRERGEIDVLRTYPIAPETFVGGVYLGRLAAVLSIIAGSLTMTGVLVPLLRPSPALTQTGGLDSPLLYARFIVFTVVFAAVVLAVMILVSATVRNARRGIVATVIAVAIVAVGLDLVIILGLAGDFVMSESLPWYLTFSPGSAYRGLVMAFVVGPAVRQATELVVPLLSLAGLFGWVFLSLTAAAWVVWRS
jgi:ABC-type transport system involved in multi-copper enzyme maturation permease subunit